MAIPGFQETMLPLLVIAGDRQEHSLAQVVEALAVQFSLSNDERKELPPSGTQAKFDNRVGWAKTHLTKAGLLQATGTGRFRIAGRGLEVLQEDPLRIDAKFLQRFPEYLKFQNPSRQGNKPDERADEPNQTPKEILESSYQSLRRDLAQELLVRVRNISPKFFERLVVDLLVAMGYGGSRKDAGQAVGESGDGGIDGIIKEDKLGLDVVYVQAKRWDGSVGRPVVQAFAGSLEGQRARKGVLITTSQFTQDAREYVGRELRRRLCSSMGSSLLS